MRSSRKRIAVSVSVAAVLILALAAARTGPVDEARLDAMQWRMDSLERRLAAYEGIVSRTATGGTELHAPLTVVDGAGKPVFDVRLSPRSFNLYDDKGNYSVLGSAIPGHSFLKVLNSTLSRVAVLAAETDDALLTFRDGAEAKSDRMKLALAGDGTAAILLYNQQHIDVLQMAIGAHGGGVIQMANTNGDPRVELGTGDNDVGVVRAGPAGGCTAPLGPIAPSCLLGRKK